MAENKIEKRGFELSDDEDVSGNTHRVTESKELGQGRDTANNGEEYDEYEGDEDDMHSGPYIDGSDGQDGTNTDNIYTEGDANEDEDYGDDGEDTYGHGDR